MSGWMIEGKNPTIEDLKEQLPLAYVVAASGVDLEPDGSGRLVGQCPFHKDTNPSFAVFSSGETDALDRCGCWSCDFGTGDLLDYIQRWREYKTPRGALGYAQKLLEQFQQDEDWTPPEPVEDAEPPPDLTATARAAFASGEVEEVLTDFIESKGLPFPWTWLQGTWWVGALGGKVYAPYLDKDRQVKALKWRLTNGHFFAIKGSRLKKLFYGAWHDSGADDVILTEGETDTWLVSWLMRDKEADVLGLPSASTYPAEELLDQLRDRRVTILFDGDEAGRDATKLWVKELTGVAAEIRITEVPSGMDACKLGESAVLDLLASAPETRFELSQQHIRPTEHGYVRTQSGYLVSDWVFDPSHVIRFPDGGNGFEDRRGWVVTSDDFMSESAIKRWGDRYGLHWFGNSRDAQFILRSIREQADGLPMGIGAREVGWYEDAFVTVTETFGPRGPDYVYVPGEVSRQFDRIVTLNEPEVRDVPRFVEAMLALHRSDVVHPLIGWTAASVTRPLHRVFPTLGVVGGSGAGKTTLVDAVLAAFGFGGGEQNLTSTTRYGLSMLVSGSRGVPVWIDEYRPGGSREAMFAMEQIIRDAWTAASSLRGGTGTNWSEVASKAATAPLVVSGEDVFSETSLLERVVLLKVPLDTSDRSPDALRVVRSGQQLGRAWLDWLLRTEWGLPDVMGGSRPEIGLTVVEWGWELWRRWLVEGWGLDVGECDLSGVRRSSEQERSLEPFHELVLWGADIKDREGRPLVWTADDGATEGRWYTYVRVRELAKAAREHEVRMPGGERAMANWLTERFGQDAGASERTDWGRALVLREVEGLEPREESGWLV
jgi:5S rRNA maturation endonuclease (ribonuclease M5)